MNTYVSVLNVAIPVFVCLLILEIIFAKLLDKTYVIRSMDTLSSLSSGLTNVIRDVLGLTIVIISYGYLVDYVALFDIKSSVLIYILAFIGIDFAGYWVHRINHSINYFWNHHIIHHSSEEFNLACALRQSISNFFSLTFVFLIPTAIIGIPAEVVALIAPLHLFAQYWYHTRLIKKMGILEYIIVTPSHHRVHHAINEEYLDKNLSQIFIVWDKLFGTFQVELDDVPPVYGVKRPVRSWNPILINFTHLWLLIKDAWRTKNGYDKLRIWFMPTGWRPSDVENKYPVVSIHESENYEKYYPGIPLKLQVWSWVQYLFTFASMMYLINNLDKLLISEALFYGAFLFLSIYSFTSLMDLKSYAWIIETIKSFLGILFIIKYGDWFLISTYSNYALGMLQFYFIISVLVVMHFSFFDRRVTLIKA